MTVQVLVAATVEDRLALVEVVYRRAQTVVEVDGGRVLAGQLFQLLLHIGTLLAARLDLEAQPLDFDRRLLALTLQLLRLLPVPLRLLRQ